MIKQYALLIDLKRCIGCHTCTLACKMENEIQTGSWINVETVGGPHTDTPLGKYPNVRMHYVPKLCYHCKQPTCIPACPTLAIYKRKDGIVLIDETKCNGCQSCLEACPYKALRFSPESRIVEKCTLCSHRIDRGLEPFCVTCCVTKAIEFGDMNNPNSRISQSRIEKKAFVLSPEKGTQPSVHYSPP